MGENGNQFSSDIASAVFSKLLPKNVIFQKNDLQARKISCFESYLQYAFRFTYMVSGHNFVRFCGLKRFAVSKFVHTSFR